jgi:dUTP pyrophosphatase
MKVKLTGNAKLPHRAHPTDAGADLFATHHAVILPNTTCFMDTGVAIELPPNTVGFVLAKSGLGTKHGIRPKQCVGTIDEPYRGNIVVALENASQDVVTIQTGQKIAQLVVMPVLYPTFEVVEELGDTERGAGGFGSTGG